VRVAHFDCFSGISGDMTLGALIAAGVDVGAIRAGLDSLGLPIKLEVEQVKRNGFAATAVRIEAPDQETHRYLADVEAIIERGALTAKQRSLALSIFRRLGAAEAAVHGHTIDKVHFHEVGALDSIADIVGSAIGLDLLGVDKFTSRPVPPGSGTVKCAHGTMPVPAPATAELLKGVPLASAPVKGELVTPTGAAILTSVVSEWVEQPALTIERIGCGAGQRDFWEQPNVLRLLVGQASVHQPHATDETDVVWVLETNIDDVSAELVGYCFELLFAAGALDVFAMPIQMKKNRPGTLLSVIASADAVPALETILFRETATFGIRRCQMSRTKLQREPVSAPTPWGPVKAKRGWRDGLCVVTPEFDDCARIARDHHVPLREVYRVVQESEAGRSSPPLSKGEVGG
jgi:pyridinium-3,5-bisthiocarboxylic acid mononucleotide nickel chelatase